MKNRFFTAINYHNVNNNSVCGGLYCAIMSITQKKKKKISSGAKWWMASSGLHMSCLGFKGEGLTENEGEQVCVLADGR